MAKKKQRTGINPAGKVAIMLVIFGIPLLFVFSSWGLSKLYDVAPYALLAVMLVIATAYTAYTAILMYKFYNLRTPILAYIPCLSELALIDMKYRVPCYILYVIAVAFAGATQLPYSIVGMLGSTFATSAPFYFLIASFVCILIIQIIKGVGISGCMKDISEEWHKQTHADVGAVNKFAPLGFIPFVRVMALYSLNKPLSTMVSFMGVSVDDGSDENSFVEEEDDEDYDDDEDY